MPIASVARADHLGRAHDIAARPNDWPMAPRFDPTNRWYRRIANGTDHEAWLLTWLPGQGTDLHDHGGSAGAFVVVSGELTEYTVVVRPGLTAGDDRTDLVARSYPTGAGRHFGRHHIHRIVNAGDRPAVSVHVYGPALRTMTRYRIEADRLLLTHVDRAGAQW